MICAPLPPLPPLTQRCSLTWGWAHDLCSAALPPPLPAEMFIDLGVGHLSIPVVTSEEAEDGGPDVQTLDVDAGQPLPPSLPKAWCGGASLPG